MRIGIMQPYFFPYIGYFQLMNAVDEFVVYDNIQFTKKGWINRNRILVNGQDSFITLPLKKDSDYLDVKDRYLADTWSNDRKKMLNRVAASYRKAPNFDAVYTIIEECILYEEPNLFKFILNSLKTIKDYLEIKTSVTVSSTLPIDHSLKAEKKVVAICKVKKAAMYINPIGGLQLYNKNEFKHEGIDLLFLKTNDFEYHQFGQMFIPWLSIIDIMMFNAKEKTKEYLESFYTLI